MSSFGQALLSPRIANLRDLGGWPAVGGGVIAYGAVFRSAQVGALDDADGTALVALGVNAIVDLRTDAERSAVPDVVPAPLEVVVADVLRDAPGAAAAQLGGRSGEALDPEAIVDLIESGRAASMLADTYRQFVTLPSATSAFKTFFETVASGAPVLVHCTAGKDRTGWAAATLLLLLGVSYDDVLRDYLLTNDRLSADAVPLLASLTSLEIDEALVRPLVGVDKAYLDAGLDELRQRFGSIETYVRDGLGVSAATVSLLRERLIVH